MSATLASMSERYERPDWVKRLIAMGESLGGTVDGARRLVPIDADEMRSAVEASLGGGPFGDFGDPQWRSAYEQVCTVADQAPLHVVGRLMTRQEIMRSLRTRGLLARALDADPSIEDETIEAPLIVTGPARSGTTILFELLSLDPTLRAPAAWEALHPVPFEGAESAEARMARAECEQDLWADVQPEFASIHELRADLPVECVTLTTPSFCGTHWPMAIAGAMPLDIDRNYAFERRMLQVLQHGHARRTWLLKTPGHLMTMEQLHTAFPDAWVVQTHRDPARTMPSTVSTTAMVHWLRSNEVDLATLVTAIGAAFTGALNGVALGRKEGTLLHRFVDVHFQRMMKDPVETLRAAYETMERTFSEEHAEAIRQYLDAKPRGKFGVHRYTASEWGFDVAQLREQLVPYIDYFGVALED